MALTKIIKTRVCEEDYEKYIAKVHESGLNQSEFFRKAVLENKTNIVKKEDTIKLLFHHNKMGNNLNQIAYALNKAQLSGYITNDLMERTLGQLNLVRRELRNIVDLILYAKGKN